MATVTKHSRNDILKGKVVGAPTCCGALQKNGKTCRYVPIFQSEFGFACGKHKARLTQPSEVPPPPSAAPRPQITAPRPRVKAPRQIECPICYDSYPKSDTITTTCKHTFCKACIQKWTGPSCPLCRCSLPGRNLPYFGWYTHTPTIQNQLTSTAGGHNGVPSLADYWRRMVDTN